MPQPMILKPVGPTVGSIRPPGSKSITNRALICAALAEGRSTLLGALDSEDTRVMVECLQKLGLQVAIDRENHSITIDGCGGDFPSEKADLFTANSGTTIRFLAAALSAGCGEYRLDGIERMRARPIGHLVDALCELGVDVSCESNNGCPPLVIKTTGLPGGQASVRGNVSSQYLSGLMMVAPRAKAPVTITVDGPLVSKPYIHITQEVIRAFGAEVQSSQPMVGVAEEKSQEPLTFTCTAPQTYQGREYEIEPDASAASYFWGVAAVTHGRVTVEGLSPDALQGDVGFCDCLTQMGCTVTHDDSGITIDATDRSLRGIDVNMNAISDTVQTLAVIALFAEGPTRVRGVAHNRHKETDRIGDLACELRKLGAMVEEFEDGLEITPGTPPEQAAIATYNDHRMAMSFALAGLRLPNIAIMEPSCTVKTYPHYFDDLKRLVGQ